MLKALYQRVVNNQRSGNWALNISTEDVGNIGSEVGLNEAQSVSLFKTLVDESFVRAQLNGGVAGGPPFRSAVVEAVTDKGLREIGVIDTDSGAKTSAFPSIKGAWEAILFYGGIPTFTVYPLGLATLYLYQKAIRTYNHTDAWYTVSLIPKTTVLGVGAEVLLRSLSFTLIAGLLALALLVVLFPVLFLFPSRNQPIGEDAHPLRHPIKRLVKETYSKAKLARAIWKPILEQKELELSVLLSILALIVVVVVLLLPSGYIVISNVGSVWVFSLLGGFLGAGLIAWDYRKKEELERKGAKEIRPRTWLLRGLIVVYVGALLSAVLAAALPGTNPNNAVQVVDLKLPKAVLDTGGEDKCTIEEPCPLLSHSDGYWNIITPQQNDILSIPDDEVTDSKVRILLGN